MTENTGRENPLDEQGARALIRDALRSAHNEDMCQMVFLDAHRRFIKALGEGEKGTRLDACRQDAWTAQEQYERAAVAAREAHDRLLQATLIHPSLFYTLYHERRHLVPLFVQEKGDAGQSLPCQQHRNS